MKKKITDFELKLYEKLGIKEFKTVLISLNDKVTNIFDKKQSKKAKKRKKAKQSQTQDNYHLDKKNYDSVKAYRKEIIFNTAIHALALSICISGLLIINPIFSIIEFTTFLGLTVLNTYCLMLQRYNWIRTDRVLKKFKPLEESKKDKVKETIKSKDKELSPHKYKVKRGYKALSVEKTTDLDSIIARANLTQLKSYRQKLDEFLNTENSKETTLEKSKYKTLKLELTPQKKYNRR